MGNFVDISYLENQVSQSLLFLTCCNISSGSPLDIGKLFKAFSQHQESGSFYILRSQLKLMSKDTPLSSNEEALFKFFHSTSSIKVNIMEVLASIITYSMCSWKIKVKLSLLVFDFDESKTLSKDEMIIMVISFIRGIGSMTNSTVYETLDLEPLGKQCFDLANAAASNVITLEDLITWVNNSEEILKLFQNYEPKPDLSKQPNKIGINTRTNRIINKKIYIRKESISISFQGRRRFTHIRNLSLPNVMDKPEWKNREKDLEELHEIFYKHINDSGYAKVGNIYQELIETNKFKREAEFFFHEFDFNANGLIQFRQLVDYIEKVKSKGGYSMKKGKETIYPNNDSIKRNVHTAKISLATLQKMFTSFDKNKDGFLTFQELKDGLKKHFTKQAIKEIFYSFDIDGNHLIDFSEFLSVFSPGKKILSRNHHIAPAVKL